MAAAESALTSTPGLHQCALQSVSSSPDSAVDHSHRTEHARPSDGGKEGVRCLQEARITGRHYRVNLVNEQAQAHSCAYLLTDVCP
jgi:hypothetical protein